MDFIGNNNNRIDLSTIKGVTKVYAGISAGHIVIYLKCDESNEDIVYKNIPVWIFQQMRITKSYMNLFIEPKK